MRFDMNREVKERGVRHRRRQRWYRRVSALAAVVVFCTTYALILPAITMEKKICKLEEHTHAQTCYVPFVEESWLELRACSLGAHVHTENCSEAESCAMIGDADVIVHTHDELCFDRDGRLLCELEELELHRHVSACYEIFSAPEAGNASGKKDAPSKGAPVETPEVEDAPIEDVPVEDIPAEEVPVETPEVEDAPAEDVPAEDTPAEEAPVENPEVEDAPAEDVPAEDTPAEEVPAETPEVEDAPVEDAPAEDTPAEEVPAETPEAEDAPVEDAPAEDIPAEEVPAEAPEVEDAPVEDMPAEDTPAEELIVQHFVVRTASLKSAVLMTGRTTESVSVAEETVEEDAPVEESPAEESPTEESPTEESPVEEPAAEEPTVEEPATEESTVEESPEEASSDEDASSTPMYSDVPLCDMEELELHTHSEDCLDESGEVACGKLQVILHQHDEQCLQTVYSKPDLEILECGMDEGAELEMSEGEDPAANESAELEISEGEDPAADESTELEMAEGEDAAAEEIEAHVHNESCYSYWMLGCGKQEHTHNANCGILFETKLELENDAMLLKLQVFDTEPLPEDLCFDLRSMSRSDAAYAPYADYAAESTPGELRTLSAYEIVFLSGGQEIQLPNAEIVAEMTVKELEIPEAEDFAPMAAEETPIEEAPVEETPAEEVPAEEVPVEETPAEEFAVQTFSLRAASMAADNEAGIVSRVEETEEDDTAYQMHLTVLSSDPGGVSDADSATVESAEDAAPVMYMSLGSSRTFALARSVEPLPTFSVEYYTYILRYYNPGSSNPVLNIINTASTNASVPVAGEARGGVLPQNGVTPNTYNLYLENSTTHSGYYRVAMEYELHEVYQSYENVLYSNSMTSHQMDAMRENDHYGIIEIWAKGADDADWAMTYPVNADYIAGDMSYEWKTVDEQYYFTNNPDAAVDDRGREPIIIAEGTILRYVYKPTSSTFSANAAMFDYDISDGGAGTGSTFEMKTGKKGINSESNYTSGNGTGSAKLAFGNSNTGSGWQNQMVNGNAINRYNGSDAGNSFRGLSFGLVTGYDPDTGKLTHNPGLTAPYLFSYEPNNVTVKGKTSYSDTVMNFNRIGDTYTLTSVTSSSSGIHDDLLELFEITYNEDGKTLYSNSFWPFDDINNGGTHDRHFGGVYNGTQTYSGIAVNYTKANGQTGTFSASGNLPASDEGDEVRNSYFGLEYQINFELDGSYTGPLEYLFYGDDDMWVFLTDHTTGKTHLIADIGGVHSSVGSYTDLWDWVPHTEERPNGKGSYSLHFFYTERGASGSSCYMQFTIPDATVEPISTEEIGSVEVSKTLSGGMTSDEDFLFSYEIEYPTGLEAERDRILPYTIYHTDSTTTTGGLFRIGQFTLKAGEKILIGNIPTGSDFSISEAVAGDYVAEWTTVPDGAMLDDEEGTVTGTITTNGQHLSFACTNTYNSLTLSKKVDAESGFGTAVEDEYAFEVLLMDANGDPLTGTINTVLRNAHGSYSTPVEVTLDAGKATVKVRADQSITFFPLPDGAKYTVTETDGGGLLPTWPDGAGSDLHSAAVSGTVDEGNVYLTCINRAYYEMPTTGGAGTTLYTMGGLLLMAAAVLLGYKKIRKEARSS